MDRNRRVGDLVYFKEAEKVGERVNDQTAQLSRHQRWHAREKFTHKLRGVVLVWWHKMLPQLLLVHEQTGTCRNPSVSIPPRARSYFKKVAHTRLPSIGFRSWSRFLAVSLQETWVINPAVGCHYFQSGLQLPSQPLKGLLPVLLLGEQRHNGCEQFA